MRKDAYNSLLLVVTLAAGSTPSLAAASAEITGELKQWHKFTLSLDGPETRESDTALNPFLDYRLDVTFTHESGAPSYRVPGYFAADGNAAETSADSGSVWRAHLSPDKPGTWRYVVSFRRGTQLAVDANRSGEPVDGCDGLNGTFEVAPTDKSGRDFRAHGRLRYVGARYLQFAGSGEYFLKAGADSPENLLGYADFDGTRSNKPGSPARPDEAAPPTALKAWAPHVRDWREGDPTWQGGRGKGLIGALNYLASTGCNAFSFLTYNAGGDGDDVWPFVERDDPLRYDCSKLDQWGIVFDHAQTLGLYLHFKLQETENDDNRTWGSAEVREVPTALDGGETEVERKLYLRELIARFGHALALNWNLGEENTQSTPQQVTMGRYLAETDPYRHHIVLHTFPHQWEPSQTRQVLTLDRSVEVSCRPVFPSGGDSWAQAAEVDISGFPSSTEGGGCRRTVSRVLLDAAGAPRCGLSPNQPSLAGGPGSAPGKLPASHAIHAPEAARLRDSVNITVRCSSGFARPGSKT